MITNADFYKNASALSRITPFLFLLIFAQLLKEIFHKFFYMLKAASRYFLKGIRQRLDPSSSLVVITSCKHRR